MAVTTENVIVMSVIVLVGIVLAIAIFMIFYEQQKTFTFPIILSIIILVIFGMGLGVYIMNTNIITGSEIASAVKAIRNRIDPGKSCDDITVCNPGINEVQGLLINDYFTYPYICDGGLCKLRPGNNTCKRDSECSRIAPNCTDGICTNYTTKTDYGDVGNAAILDKKTGQLSCKSGDAVVLNTVFSGQSISDLSTLCVFPSYDEGKTPKNKFYTCSVNGIKSVDEKENIFCYAGLCNTTNKLCMNKGLGQVCGIRDNNPYLDECGTQRYCSIYTTVKGAESGTCQLPGIVARNIGAYCSNNTDCNLSLCVNNRCINPEGIKTLLDDCIPSLDSCSIENPYDVGITAKCVSGFRNFCILTSLGNSTVNYNRNVSNVFVEYAANFNPPRIEFNKNTRLENFNYPFYEQSDHVFFNNSFASDGISRRIDNYDVYEELSDVKCNKTNSKTCPIYNLISVRNNTITNPRQASIPVSYQFYNFTDPSKSYFNGAIIIPPNFSFILFNGNPNITLVVHRVQGSINIFTFDTARLPEQNNVILPTATNLYNADINETSAYFYIEFPTSEIFYTFGNSSNFGIYYETDNGNNIQIHTPYISQNIDTVVFINNKNGNNYILYNDDQNPFLNSIMYLNFKGSDTNFGVKENFILSCLPEGVVYLTRGYYYNNANDFGFTEYFIVLKKYIKQPNGTYNIYTENVNIGSGFANTISPIVDKGPLEIIYDLKTDLNKFQLLKYTTLDPKLDKSELYENKFIFYGYYAGNFGLFYGVVNYTNINNQFTADFRITSAPTLYQNDQFGLGSKFFGKIFLEQDSTMLINGTVEVEINTYDDTLIQNLVNDKNNKIYRSEGIVNSRIIFLSSILKYFNFYPSIKTIGKS